MTNIKFSRKNIFAIFIGFLVIVGMGIITSTISVFVVPNIMHNIPARDFQAAFFEQPTFILSWILKGISFISPILGGLVVGWIVKEKGWLYGGLLGVLLQLTSIGIVSSTFFLPTSVIWGPSIPVEYGHSLALKNILDQLLDTPTFLALTLLGGWLGERLYKIRRDRNIDR